MTTASTSEIQPTRKGGPADRPTSIASITLAACLLFWVFVFGDSGWGPILTPLSNQLHISLVTVGLFYVLWSIGYLPGALIGGAILDRYGPRRVLFGAALLVFCGILCIFLGLLLPRLVPMALLLIFAALAGVGGGVIDASTNGLISGIYASKRGMALNLFNLLYPLGGVIVALIDAALLTLFHNDPRPAFLFTLCFIIAALFSLLAVPRTYRIGSVPTEQLQQEHPLAEPAPLHSNLVTTGNVDPRSIVGSPLAGILSGGQVIRLLRRSSSLVVTLAPVIAVMMLTAGISASVRAWAPTYLHVAYRQTPAIAAVLSSITWALSAASRLGAAALILRIGSWKMVILGILVALLGLIAMMLSPNALIATLAIALTGIGLSPLFATCLAIGTERVGRSPGSVAGILLFTVGSSTVFCSWTFGFLLNTIGPTWATLFCFTSVVLGGLLALRLRKN
jgi:MFS family permease